MKKLTILAVALMMSVAAMAQQALWGGATAVSPEINADNSVTFRLNAPKARAVQVSGDFADGAANMVQNERGVWEYTTEPLAPELYSYAFTMDGVKIADPSNVYQIRDVASVTNYFIIGGGQAELYKTNDVPHGSIHKDWYYSASEDFTRRLTVYTPAAYDGKKRFPVLYLLHGIGGDEEAWMDLGRASQILDNLIAKGEAEPMIVVMTNGNISQQAAPGYGPEGFPVPSMGLPKTMEGSFEAAFPEVVKFIDGKYRTIAKKSSRAIAGLSMGGFHSMHISKEYPDMFNYVGLFSAALNVNGQQQGSPIYQNVDQKVDTQFAKGVKLYWIACGNTDFLIQNNRDFMKGLDARGHDYIYYETEGGHIWRNWRDYLSKFVPQIFK